MADTSDSATDGSHRRRRSFGKGRMEAFSDGVFAIAVTLLVLDLAIPVGSGRNLVIIAVGLFAPVVAVIGYLVIAIFIIVPIPYGARARSG